jgi:glycosyltransferase involved in cell wall biosynthesis
MPRVSVIVPCHDLGRFLPEALDSIYRQTYGDFDVLVVDDGSTDPETLHVLREISERRTRVERTGNRGRSAARNTGIRLTSGDYICSVDADDRLEPSWLQTAVDRLDADPGLSFVSHWLQTFGDEDWSWTPTRCDLVTLLDRNAVNGAALVRRAVAEASGGFDESMREGCEDWEFWLRLVAQGHRGAIVPEVMYRYRRRHDSMSRTMHVGDTHHRIYEGIVERHQAVFREHLLDLVLRREQTFVNLQRRIVGLEEQLSLSLEPALAEREQERAGVAVFLGRVEALERAERELRTLSKAHESLDEAHTRLAQAADTLGRRV